MPVPNNQSYDALMNDFDKHFYTRTYSTSDPEIMKELGEIKLKLDNLIYLLKHVFGNSVLINGKFVEMNKLIGGNKSS